MIQKVRKLKTDKRLEKKFDYLEFLNPEKCYYHLTTSRCKSGEATIEIGDKVTIGQVIGQRDGGFFKQNIHSTISGTYVGNEKHLYRNNSMVEYMVIENDFQETYTDAKTDLSMDEMLALSKEEIHALVRDNSNVGLGGSSFPAYIKLEIDKDINTILINGVECEPYLTTDVNTMYKNAEKIIDGIYLMMKYFGAKEGILTVKSYKEKLVSHLEKVIAKKGYDGIKLCPTPDYYPQGYEKDVIKTATGTVVPPGVMPAEFGYMVFNSTSILAIYDSIKHNLPILNREISLIGHNFKNQTDLTVKVGTHIPTVLEKIGGYKDESIDQVLICGGPMMGTSLKNDDIVVTKAFSTLITMDPVEEVEQPCINCGSCVKSCPSNLQPVLINQALQARDKEAIARLNIKNCIECGLCSYVCTSKIDLTKNMRRSKRMV